MVLIYMRLFFENYVLMGVFPGVLRNKKYICVLVILILAFVFVEAIPVSGEDDRAQDNAQVRAKILSIVTEDIPEAESEQFADGFKMQYAEVKILEGVHKGRTITAQNVTDDRMAYNISISEGDEVLLFLHEDEEGNILDAYVAEIYRQKYLLYLGLAFAVFLIIFGGVKGVKAILTLALTGIAIIKVLLPCILKGYDPILISLGICAAVTAITLIIISGFNKKTLSAIIGTTGGVIVAGCIALLMSSLAKLTGLGNEEAQMLLFLPQKTEFNFKGLLFSGIILGALGAVMDVGMSIASAMTEIEANNPEIKTKDLIKSGMNVGRDVMGTMSNTLILAYTGGSLHMMLLFMAHEIPFYEVINWDMIASEVVRALAGSIGLIFAIPITAIVSGYLGREKANLKG